MNRLDFTKGIKGAIFDIDGVLLDSMGIWKELGARYLHSKGVVPEAGLAEILFSMSMEQGASYLRTHYLPSLSESEIGKGIGDMLRDFYFHEVKAKAGAESLLAALKAGCIRICAATSSPREHVERALERNGLLPYMERIFTSAEIGSSKHSPEIYDAASQFMGLERGEVCVFEDSLYALKTAADAGYRTVGVFDENGESDQEGVRATADIYIRSIEELLK